MTTGTVISLFTGGMGLDLGFEREGFETRVCVEKDPWAVKTIKAHDSRLPVIPHDIAQVTTDEILGQAHLGIGEATVLTGAPPCEPFSTAGRRNGHADHRAQALYEYLRVIKQAKPRYFVFEEVASFMTSAKRHISFYDRVVKSEDQLDPDERLGSFFQEVIQEFLRTGYTLSYDLSNPKASILNAADYGVPQKRKRFILIGAREGGRVPLPLPTHGDPKSIAVCRGERLPWKTLADALDGLHDPAPEYGKFSPVWARFLSDVPPGGCWRDLRPELQKKALGGAYDDQDNARTKGKKGGRTGFLRRLSWDKPAPTLVDSPTTKAACLCHPELGRPLSVREYAQLQGFLDSRVFCGPTSAKYRLIGQATPVPLAAAIAKVIKVTMDTQVTVTRTLS